MNNIVSVTTNDGKYTVVLPEDGGLHVLRYGERWRECAGDKLVLQLAMDLEQARDRAVDAALATVWREVAAAQPDPEVMVLLWHKDWMWPVAGTFEPKHGNVFMGAGGASLFVQPSHWLPITLPKEPA